MGMIDESRKYAAMEQEGMSQGLKPGRECREYAMLRIRQGKDPKQAADLVRNGTTGIVHH
jgi:hypothetical protein